MGDTDMNQFETFELVIGTTRDDKLRRQAIISEYVNSFCRSTPTGSSVITPDQYLIRVGNRFRSYRNSIHHSQYDYSVLLSTSQSNISRMESGCGDITVKHLYQLKNYAKSFDPLAILGKEIFSGDPLFEQFVLLKTVLNDEGLAALTLQMQSLYSISIFRKTSI